ncbi:MAG: hypothetical protein R6V44_09915 [Paracoccaceae bacterium]
MERRGESGMEVAERRALVSRVEALERRVAAMESAAFPAVPTGRPSDRPAPNAGGETEDQRLRRRAEERTPRREGASLRHLGVTRRSDGTSLVRLVRATVLIALGFLVALGVGWVVVIAQQGGGEFVGEAGEVAEE